MGRATTVLRMEPMAAVDIRVGDHVEDAGGVIGHVTRIQEATPWLVLFDDFALVENSLILARDELVLVGRP